MGNIEGTIVQSLTIAALPRVQIKTQNDAIWLGGSPWPLVCAKLHGNAMLRAGN
jgi:hypothetical protein